MAEPKHDQWTGQTYGGQRLHRWLVGALRLLDVRLLYLFAFLFVVPVTLIVNSKARKAIYHFYRQMGYGKMRAAWLTVKNQYAFSTVIVDRFAMYAGKRFKIEIEGYEKFKELSQGESGFVQLSSHTGNYEIAGYSLVAKEKRFNALVYGGEKASVMANRNRLFDSNNIRMIPMADGMEHLFIIDQALSNGEILSIAADRVFGSDKVFPLRFMGGEAIFPQGPFIIAAVRNLPVLFVTVNKSGIKRYRISCRRIEYPTSGPTRVKARQIAESYVKLLEDQVRKHPAQWYNYFEFFKQNETD